MGQKEKELIIITGMSGAGKSQAIDYFEDRGYFCIDNFPLNLFQYLNDLFLNNQNQDMKKIAVIIDIRNYEFINQFSKQLDLLNDLKINYTVIYLDARDDILLKRYELSRRKHPLNLYNTLLQNIKEERKLIKDFMLKADVVIDTSTTTTKEFEQILNKEFNMKSSKLSINLTSFGFKYGIPLDLHLMFDLRFLPNPYYIDDLKKKTGNHVDVQNYVMNSDESKVFFKMLSDMLIHLIPQYEKDGKAHLRIGIGCSGGQHRSVTYVNKLYNLISDKFDYNVSKYHREVNELEEME